METPWHKLVSSLSIVAPEVHNESPTFENFYLVKTKLWRHCRLSRLVRRWNMWYAALGLSFCPFRAFLGITNMKACETLSPPFLSAQALLSHFSSHSFPLFLISPGPFHSRYFWETHVKTVANVIPIRKEKSALTIKNFVCRCFCRYLIKCFECVRHGFAKISWKYFVALFCVWGVALWNSFRVYSRT